MSKRWAFILVVLGLGFLAQHQARASMFDAPLPEDLFVMEPAPEVPSQLKAFSGKWTGKLIGAQIQSEHTMVVERMDPNMTWVVWAIGPGRSIVGGGQSGWFRVPGLLNKSSELVLLIGSARVVYRLSGPDELEVVSTVQGFNQKGTLKRVAMPVLPYTSKQPPTYWPNRAGRGDVKPTTSTVVATFPETAVISPVKPDTPPERAKWLGKWVGSACNDFECDVKLAVLSVTADSARVIQLFASKWGPPEPAIRDAVFEGDELILRAGRMRTAYRMRPSGQLDVFRVDPNGTFVWGALAKEP
ncbi:hypothetical protein [Variovorax sp. YR216]|uniref:hypothetical protein n=1 Tax=Variovorax sp. YR216 TaxID=1882828 RepID=UPI0008953F6B|nr:hypothetical protein [Variovorax sp. YR216]SEB26297.1 hypothetical protein SAMN05444680_1313 [Variovorax sp. YR216]